jgi:dihydroneopterin aldolase
VDILFIDDLRLTTRIGVYEWEKAASQPIVLDLQIGMPSSRPCESDDFADVLDYAAVVRRLQAFAREHPHHLLERFAEAVAQLVLGEFGAPWVRVRVAKLAPMPGVRQLGVVIERSARQGEAARPRSEAS